MVKRIEMLLLACVMGISIAVTAFAEDTYKIDNSKKYAGIYTTTPQEISVFGNSINIIGWFDTLDSDSSQKISLCLDEHQYIAFITLQPRGLDMGKLAKGEYDDKIITYLSKLSEGDRVNTELFIRFAHEFEMRPNYKKPWYEWQGKDSKKYIAAWKHMVDLGRQYAPNVKWVWSPNRADKYTKAYYPGDDYVDYISLSLNNFKDKYQTFQQFYEEVGQRSYLEKYTKPIIFGETGEHCDKASQKKAYIDSLVEFVSEYDRAIGFVILNDNLVNGDGEKRNFKFADNDEMLSSFVEKAGAMINRE